MSFILGLDLGQSHDYTALAILERRDGGAYEIRHLHRFPLGTSYPAIVDHVADLLRRPPLRGYMPVVVDATGVGAPVVDLLRRCGLAPEMVEIHGGAGVSRGDDGSYRVPKRDLASVVAVLLQGGRLRVAAALHEAQTLVAELLAFRAKVTIAGHDTFEALRERDHDDLVLAVALACWYAEHHAGVPVFADVFSVDAHVAPERITPQPGIPIVRGWRTTEPAACVLFQVDPRRRCRVFYELAPEAGRGLRTAKGIALATSNTLFPGFEFVECGPVEKEDPAIIVLTPEVMLIPGEASREKQWDAARRWLERLVGGAPAVEIDPGCHRLIAALAGGYVFRRVRGVLIGEVEENAHAAIADAFLGALATPVATMTPGERARLMGPRDLSAWMR